MKKYYLDTAIWRDLHENRVDKFRPLGEWAFELFKRIEINEEKVLYSEFVINELRVSYSEKEIRALLDTFSPEKILLKVDISESQTKEAKILCRSRKVAFGDALHAVLARDNDAILITRDKHFLELLDIVEIRKPEDLI